MDKGEFFDAGPAFELLFAGNGAAGVVIALVVDETVAVVVRGEAFEDFVFVFSDAWFDATRYTDVECVGAAGDDVDVIPAFAHVESVASFSRLSK